MQRGGVDLHDDVRVRRGRVRDGVALRQTFEGGHVHVEHVAQVEPHGRQVEQSDLRSRVRQELARLVGHPVGGATDDADAF